MSTVQEANDEVLSGEGASGLILPLPVFDIVKDALLGGDGCEVAPHCLTCPLAACIYDVPMVTQRRETADAEVMRLHDGGTSVADIMRATGRSRRTVFRTIQNEEAKRAREAKGIGRSIKGVSGKG